MKLVAIFALSIAMTGCAHISEYNQGCRDGLENSGFGVLPSWRDKFCNDLDGLHKEKQEQPRSKTSG